MGGPITNGRRRNKKRIFACIVAATFFSLVSAQLTNKVKGKVVGYVTGAILPVFGLSMIIKSLFSMPKNA